MNLKTSHVRSIVHTFHSLILFQRNPCATDEFEDFRFRHPQRDVLEVVNVFDQPRFSGPFLLDLFAENWHPSSKVFCKSCELEWQLPFESKQVCLFATKTSPLATVFVGEKVFQFSLSFIF